MKHLPGRKNPLNRFCASGSSRNSEEAKTRPGKLEILQSALSHVQTRGWSDEALAKGCQDQGLSVASVGLFPNGAGDLVIHFMDKCNLNLDTKLAQLNERPPSAEERFASGHHERTTEKLAAAIQLRLEMLVPYLDTWPQAMAIGAAPPMTLEVHSSLSDTMEIIWRHVGDDSSGPERYAKRVALSTVYVATELHLLTDKSEGRHETWNFLAGRMKEMSTMGKTVNEALRNAPVGLGLFSATIQAAQAVVEKNRGQLPDDLSKIGNSIKNLQFDEVAHKVSEKVDRAAETIQKQR